VNEANSKKSDEVEQILRLLSCSDLRNNLAQALRNGKKMTLAQLSEHVGASSSACVHSLRELTKEHVTRQDKKRNYSLTNIGEIVTRKFEEFNTTITALSHNREFWLDHDLSGIPKHLLDKIGNLADYEIISSTAIDLFSVFKVAFTLLGNCKEIYAISPFFVEDVTIQLILLVDKKIDVHLIVTPGVLDAILGTADRKELENAVKIRLKLFKIESQANVAFTVTDYFLQLGLFKPDGQFDWSKGLLSYSPNALAWGQELFAYYLEKAEPVIL
jgi:predicted transcriptional regulator